MSDPATFIECRTPAPGPHQLMFGSDAATPHQQYVLFLEQYLVLRFLAWKFTPAQMQTNREGFRDSRQVHLQVPGYNIILFAQAYSFGQEKWLNVCEKQDNQPWISPAFNATPAMIELATNVIPYAVKFYLQFKIQPRARKFARYEEPGDCPEGIEPAHRKGGNAGDT